MSSYIVLVKQVPDVSRITDNAFHPETGTLIRSKLTNVINELDAQALAFAARMRELSGDSSGKIVCLTMGPPMAEEVLRYSLGRLADEAVLLTDRALGGADTVATANPLAFAIRKIVRETLHESNDYFVISGMQSVDGDTAQVPAQVAEELKLGCIPYVTNVEFKDNRFEFTRIITGGSEVVRARTVPVVLTVAKYEYPLFPSFARTRQAASVPIKVWGAAEIQADHIGGEGSKTWVTRIFPPAKSSRKCKELRSVREVAEVLLAATDGKAAAAQAEGGSLGADYVLPARRTSGFDRQYEAIVKDKSAYALLADKLAQLGVSSAEQITEEMKKDLLKQAEGKFSEKVLNELLKGYSAQEPSYRGEVWAVTETGGSGLLDVSYELVGKCAELARGLETKAGAVVLGSQVERYAADLIAAGADNVYLLDHDTLGEFDPLSHRRALSDLIAKYWPQIVLYGATPRGRVLAPMVSYRLGCGLTADCTGLNIRDISRQSDIGVLTQTRPALGGNVMATICTKDSRVQMATARPGVFKRLPADAGRTGGILREEVKVDGEDYCFDVLRRDVGTGSVDFGAEVIISGGRGMQTKGNYDELLNSLIAAVQGRTTVRVEKGASRAAVEEGFTERIRQVGQTGTAVGPRVYIALGISGAIQHMIGVANSETIIAVNSDPHAPILRQADYYMIGNIEKVVPELVQALQV